MALTESASEAEDATDDMEKGPGADASELMMGHIGLEGAVDQESGGSSSM